MMAEYLRVSSTAVDPADVAEMQRLFAADVRPAFAGRAGCLGLELAVCVTHNAGGLVDAEAISRWASLPDMDAALASREIQEAMVRVRQILRQEPVSKVLEILQ
jgi:quinol monooxygenase YgiN